MIAWLGTKIRSFICGCIAVVILTGLRCLFEVLTFPLIVWELFLGNRARRGRGKGFSP